MNESWKNSAVYPWAALMMLCAVLIKDNYVFNLLRALDQIAPIYIVVPIAVLFIVPRFVPLRFTGIHGKFKGIVMYPIFENVAFRELVLPLLLTISRLDVSIEYISLNWAIIISAFLFGLMHLLSYGFNKASIKNSVFAFAGGLFMGYLACVTSSILLGMGQHMVWNTMLAINCRCKTPPHFLNMLC